MINVRKQWLIMSLLLYVMPIIASVQKQSGINHGLSASESAKRRVVMAVSPDPSDCSMGNSESENEGKVSTLPLFKVVSDLRKSVLSDCGTQAPSDCGTTAPSDCSTRPPDDVVWHSFSSDNNQPPRLPIVPSRDLSGFWDPNGNLYPGTPGITSPHKHSPRSLRLSRKNSEQLGSPKKQ